MKQIDWLNKELPTWVREGLITQDEAYQISKKYHLQYDNAKLTFSLIYKIVGIGLGAITALTLLSLGWGKMSTELRLIVILICFFAPIIWAIYVLVKKVTQLRKKYPLKLVKRQVRED